MQSRAVLFATTWLQWHWPNANNATTLLLICCRRCCFIIDDLAHSPPHRSEDNNKIQSWLDSKRPAEYRGKKPFANKILWITNFDGQPTRHPHGDASQYAEYGISHTLDEVRHWLNECAPVCLAKFRWAA